MQLRLGMHLDSAGAIVEFNAPLAPVRFLLPMFIHSRQVGLAYSAWSAPLSDGQSPQPAANSAVVEDDPWVKISAAARLAQETSTGSAPSSARAEFDTNRGRREIDIGQYFSGQGQANDAVTLRDSLPPLMLPTEANVTALSRHLAEAFPRFLAARGIPEAPASLRYDADGKVQLPADYPHAQALQTALQKDPAMARELSTLNALASHLAQLNQLIPFNQEYAAARNPGEAAAVVAKYSHLFSARRPPVESEVVFTSDGRPTPLADGRPLGRTAI
ncbi:hypothetical protein VX159_09625 [Dechloromonas sp. ZY10]|uniref:hypothetical protein n=1 Tax=Dechloromonas aquae TaxID=2664436 RepID=UPI003527A2BC